MSSGVLQAEVIRTKGSATAFFPLLGVGIGVVITALGFVAGRGGFSSGVIEWQALYVTGLWAPLIALLVGITNAREKNARCGGTDLRPVAPRRVRCARVLVLIGITALFTICLFGTTALGLLAAGEPGAVTMVEAAGVATVASISLVALWSVLGRFMGTIPLIAVAVVWQFFGTGWAESPSWMLLPPVYPVRAMLPVLGIHQNSVAIEAGNPLADESPMMALGLSLVVALVCLVLLGVGHGLHLSWRGVGGVTLRSSRSGALTIVLMRTSLPILVVVAIALGLVMWWRYPVDVLLGFYTYLLLPLGAGLIPVIAWPVLRDVWPLMVARVPGLRLRLVAYQAGIVVVMSVIFGLLGSVPPRGVVLWVLTGVAVATLSLCLQIRFGTGAAVAFTLVVLIVSATLGGDILADTWMWIFGFTAWALTVGTSVVRAVVAVVVSAAVCGCAAALVMRAMRRFESGR